MERDNEKHNKGLIVAVILLLITVGILLWLLLKPVPEPEKISTGNVDVFDIRIGCICKDENDEDCKKDEDGFIPYSTPGKSTSGKKRASRSSERKINGETNTDVEHEGIVYVDDANGRYVYQRALKIFENAAFEYTNKIAPGVSNSYNFKVHNETDNAIRYNIEFVEDSEYAINMRYRLKRAGEYIVGSDTKWVNANELASALKALPMDGIDTYTLDWEWPYESGHDVLDTEIGENMVSEYGLKIKINFEEV